MPSRILAVVDAYDAMTAPSDFRIITPKAALMRLNEAAGTQFDTTVVQAMDHMIRHGRVAAA